MKKELMNAKPNTSEEMRDNLQDIIAALIKNKKNQIYLSID